MKITNGVKKMNPPVLVDVLLVFLVGFIPKFLIAMDSVTVTTISDEISAISVAAFLAGYDWRDIVSNAGYYGIGYLFIFFPLFRAGISAIAIYRIILAFNAVVIGLTGVVCYSILSKFFQLENRVIKIMISCTCGCMSIFSTSITRARNEDIYILCGWVFAYIILNLLEETIRGKRKYELMLSALLLYMLTVHTRAVTYIIVLLLACGMYWLFFHRKLVSKFFWLFLLFGCAVTELALKLYQTWVWQSSSARNSSLGGTVSSAFSKFSIDFTMIKSMCMIVLGQFFTAFSLSGGIFLVSFTIFVIYLYQCVKKRDSLQIKEIRLLALGILYGLMIMITIGGQSITWGVAVYGDLMAGTTDYVYSYKAFTYMRYMGSYVPPFIMVSLVIIWNNWNMWKKIRIWMPISYIVLFRFWISEILPYVKDTKSNMEFFISIVSLPDEVNSSIAVWHQMFLLLFIMLFFWIFFNGRKSFAIKLLVIGILFTSYERMEIFYNRTLISEERIYSRVDGGYAVIQQMHDKLLANHADICVVETQNKTNHQVWYLYQFMNYDLHIIPGSKDEIAETDIIFSNGEIEKYLDEEYISFRLDENEYLYCKNIDYSDMIREMGYEEIVVE